MGAPVGTVPDAPPDIGPARRKAWRWPLALGVCAAVLAGWAYSGCLLLFFAQDDFWMLSHAQQPGHGLLLFFKGIFPEYVRPITTCWMPCLLYALAGVDPLIYKGAQLAVFALSLAALWFLLRELTHDRLTAWLGSSVLAFSPVHAYTLGWFAGIIDNLFLLFFMLALLLLARCVTRSDCSWKSTCLLLAAFAGALLSKENGILILPAACAASAAMAVRYRRAPTRQEIAGLCGMTLLTAAYLIFRKLAVTAAAGKINLCWAPGRALAIWRHAIESVPLADRVHLAWGPWLPLAVAGLLFALALGGLWRSAAPGGRRGNHAGLFLASVLGLALFVLNAAIFAFQPQPAQLDNYYSTLCMLGLVLSCSSLLAWSMRAPAARWLAPLIAILAGIYALAGAARIHNVIERAQSPSLFLAGKSQRFYGQIRPYAEKTRAATIVIRGADELTWWASGKGFVIPVMFQGKSAYFPEYDAASKPTPPLLELTLQPDGTVQAVDAAPGVMQQDFR